MRCIYLTIGKEIQVMIDNRLGQYPAPTECQITKVYESGFVDAETSNGDLKYIRCIGGNIRKGSFGVVVYLDGGFDKCVIIT